MLLDLLARMRDRRAVVALVAPSGEAASVDRIVGLITKERLIDFMGEAAEWFQN
jgi:hypothetical protein